MDPPARNALESEVLFYITSALVTFLAVIVSFKWVYRKTGVTKNESPKEPTKRNVCPVHPDGENTESITEDKSLQASSSGDGTPAEPASKPKEDDAEDEVDINDLLIKHADIMPLQCPFKTEESPDGKEEGIEGKTKNLAGPQKTKKLVEEVSKMMSDEQKAEERRIQAEQLEAIFKLVQNQQDTFGIGSMEDIEDQFKLYA